jgi:hypothetical protein
MPSGAEQLLSHRSGCGRGGRCRHREVVMGCRAPQTLHPEPGLDRPAGVAVVVAVQDVRTPATPLVALSAVEVRPMVGRTSGVHATGVQATGAIRVSGRTRPVSAAAASAVRTVLDPGTGGCGRPIHVAQRVGGVAVVGERRGRRCRVGTGGRGMVVRLAVRWLAGGSAADLGLHLACAEAAAPRLPPGRPREPVQRPVPVGWLGSTRGSRCFQVPGMASWAGAGALSGHGAGAGGGDHARWSLSWSCSGVVRLRRPHRLKRT